MKLQDALDVVPTKRTTNNWAVIEDTARRVANLDYEAAARCRWEARFGEGSWDHPNNQDDQEFSYSHDAFMRSAIRDVNAALGITTKDDDGD